VLYTQRQRVSCLLQRACLRLTAAAAAATAAVAAAATVAPVSPRAAFSPEAAARTVIAAFAAPIAAAVTPSASHGTVAATAAPAAQEAAEESTPLRDPSLRDHKQLHPRSSLVRAGTAPRGQSGVALQCAAAKVRTRPALETISLSPSFGPTPEARNRTPCSL
jgi:hypothetical protein